MIYLTVRYVWRNWVVGVLYDTNLLPASSFKADDWDDAKPFMELEYEEEQERR